tara:strand:- start:1869 stop:2024 length:156 start_codon:yes stop_codon:yes gene_type:complete
MKYIIVYKKDWDELIESLERIITYEAPGWPSDKSLRKAREILNKVKEREND